MNFVLIQCCPVPVKFAPVLSKILADSHAILQSCDRSKEARPWLAKCGKHDQEYLWIHQHDPGFNPANPPGRSTHERRSDGVAYRGPVGRPLLYWQVGIDVDDAHVAAFIQAARKHGWLAFRPYPTGSEYHHINFKKEPKITLPKLKYGSKGPRVVLLTTWLAKVHDPQGKPYLLHRQFTFDGTVQGAIKRFQRDHHLMADGVVGAGTKAQLVASYRYWKTHAS